MKLNKYVFPVGILVLGLVAGYFGRKFSQDGNFASSDPVPEWKTAVLKDTSGKDVRLGELPGNIFVLYFGFSHCPDMCPMALTDIEKAFSLLGNDAQNAKPIFITVDPERDTPEVLRKYVERFPGKDLEALTGTKEEIEGLQKGFGSFSRKVQAPNAPDGYGVDHSLFIYLVDREGRILKAFPTGIKGEELAEEIRKVL
ncbi:SCO family protein [Leptospira wolffii]|uniref:SCO family protein n=1 Tax=Leptospira wolffii TaxID=409998 RepID=A0ABV5BLE3_9LEPT|nr:SCO family protein [Leptospira wolffii]EPG67711.1 SCO1/SenC [Leptospira wolffii serovar Khorat str. Khorat-H2]